MREEEGRKPGNLSSNLWRPVALDRRRKMKQGEIKREVNKD